MTALEIMLWGVLLLLAIPAVLACLYLLGLTLFSWRNSAASEPNRALRFDVIIPAHNEAAGITRTLTSLSRLQWPQAGFRIFVVADNCSDDTASIAASQGAHVLERRDDNLRGKGYALRYAFDRSAEDAWADAVVVVDADSEVSPSLLSAIATELARGAHAVQAHYDVLNPDVSWRTRLMTIAMGAFHTVRSRARERLGLSCGIRGNGWCVTHALLKQVPYRAYSLTEDIEYGIDLGVQGYRVHYTENAKVFGEMVSSASRAGSQRQRWEQGRFQLIRERTLPLLRLAIARPSRVCLDLALDLMVLPLSYVVLNVIGLGLYSGLGALIDARLLLGLWLAMAWLLCLILYFLRGWSLSGTGLRGLGALLCAPAFIVWKLIVVVTGRRTTQWTRTEREQP